jgi:glutaredoxin
MDKINNMDNEIVSSEYIYYLEPFENSFTIYTKSGCKFCTEVKKLLKSLNIFFQIIDCDDYIVENKQTFLDFIQNLTKSEIKTFPIVFNEKKEYIGGYIDTEKYLEPKLSFDENF